MVLSAIEERKVLFSRKCECSFIKLGKNTTHQLSSDDFIDRFRGKIIHFLLFWTTSCIGKSIQGICDALIFCTDTSVTTLNFKGLTKNFVAFQTDIGNTLTHCFFLIFQV